jgi:hypothetical protein
MTSIEIRKDSSRGEEGSQKEDQPDLDCHHVSRLPNQGLLRFTKQLLGVVSEMCGVILPNKLFNAQKA